MKYASAKLCKSASSKYHATRSKAKPSIPSIIKYRHASKSRPRTAPSGGNPLAAQISTPALQIGKYPSMIDEYNTRRILMLNR